MYWDFPTFKDIDCKYFFHVYDKKEVDIVISTSSANTVEGMARVLKDYNNYSGRNIIGILLVPDISAYKVDKNIIDHNPNISFVVLKNSNLDNVRILADKLKAKLKEKYNVVMADANLKTSAYAQIGVALNKLNLMNDNCCIVQTVSGGVGPAGLIESAYKMNLTPEILLTQPEEGHSAPIVDALEAFELGKNPIKIFDENKYKTPEIETTLGSTKPVYAIKKYV